MNWTREKKILLEVQEDWFERSTQFGIHLSHWAQFFCLSDLRVRTDIIANTQFNVYHSCSFIFTVSHKWYLIYDEVSAKRWKYFWIPLAKIRLFEKTQSEFRLFIEIFYVIDSIPRIESRKKMLIECIYIFSYFDIIKLPMASCASHPMQKIK